MGQVTGTEVVEPVRRRRLPWLPLVPARVVQAFRWAAVAVLVADVLLGLLTLPRPADVDELERDLSQGRVRSAGVVDPGMLRSSQSLLGRSPHNQPTSTMWRVGPLGYRITPQEGLSRSSTKTSALQDELRAVPDVEDDLLMRWTSAGALTHVLLVLVLLYGPQPRRATKWAWFWLTFLPFDAGLLALLLRDAPWSRRATAVQEPLGHRVQPDDHRLTGGRALLLAVALGLLGQLVVDSLSHHLW